MYIFETVSSIKTFIRNANQKQQKVGFVPTMGALHSGHISLIERSREENNLTVCSIFVNPNQFTNKDDLNNYPRTIEKDIQLLEDAGCDVLFFPSVEEVYPSGSQVNAENVNDIITSNYNSNNKKIKLFTEGAIIFEESIAKELDFGILDKIMEGRFRPGHFDGVAKVVCRLFDIVTPHNAYFGQKDYQQLTIIKSMVKQLNIPVVIVPCPIIRESDGLAMSSRNTRLTDFERAEATVISRTIFKAKEISEGVTVRELKHFVFKELENHPTVKLEYFEICDAVTLHPISKWDEADQRIGCIAAFVGKIRLIDNIIF